jgi:hypothetical protein
MMIAAIVVLALVAAGALAAVGIMHARTVVPISRRPVLINFVHQEHGAVRGVLFSRRAEYFCLKNAALVQSDGSLVPIDGDVLIHRAQIVFLQVLPH